MDTLRQAFLFAFGVSTSFAYHVLDQSAASAQLLFIIDFESTLTHWTGKNGGGYSGAIVEDPIRSANSVLTFTALTGAGDIFSPEIIVAPGPNYVLGFEYLGLPGQGEPGDLGGFIGFAEDLPGGHRWLDGTKTGDSENDSLTDDGQWHSYRIRFDPFDPNKPGHLTGGDPLSPSNNTIHLMLEDFDVSIANIPGDAFFDNIFLTFMPPISGDLNGDEFVGQGDLGIVLNGWGETVTPDIDFLGDLSGDGFVGQDDLNDLLVGWGQGIPPLSSITFRTLPEPPSVVLLAGAAIALVIFCRRRNRRIE